MKRSVITLAFLLTSGMALCVAQSSPVQEAKPAAKPQEFVLTELQRAKLDAAAQRFWRVQDRANELLNEFGKLCLDAAKENKWPAVRCNPDNLSVVLDAPPTPAPPTPIEPPKADAPPKK